jgi:hypothetical protein
MFAAAKRDFRKFPPLSLLFPRSQCSGLAQGQGVSTQSIVYSTSSTHYISTWLLNLQLNFSQVQQGILQGEWPLLAVD